MTDVRVHPWKIDPRTGLRLEALGMRPPRRGETGAQPIWPIMGAAEDDDAGDEGDDAGDDGDDVGDDEDDEDDGDDPDAGKSPEDLRAELRALRASRAKLLREKANRTKGKPKDGDGKEGKDTLTREDVDDLVEETKAAERQALMPAIVRTQSKSVLSDLGMAFDKDPAKAKAQLTRVLKLADTDGLDLGDDGEIDGLEHALRAVKRDFPQLFRGTKPPRVGNASGNGRPSTKPKTATEMQAVAIFGGGDDD